MNLIKKNKIINVEIIDNKLVSSSSISVVDKLVFICSICGIETSKGVGMFHNDFSIDNLICKNCMRKRKLQEKYGVDNVSQLPNHKEKMMKKNREKYGVDFYIQTKECKERVKETCIEKYGAENVFQSKKVQEKIKQINLEKYGVSNPMKNKSVSEKTAKTLIERYGGGPLKAPGAEEKRIATLKERYGEDFTSIFCSVDTPKTIKDVRDNLAKKNILLVDNYRDEDSANSMASPVKLKCYCGEEFTISVRNIFRTFGCYKHYNHPVSMEEKEVAEFINSLGFSTEKYIMENKKHIDIFIKEKNIGFEYDGLYWHSQKKLEERDLNGERYHLEKMYQAYKEDITLYHIFEDEWLYRKEQTKRKIMSLLGIREEKIFARKTIIREIPTSIKNDFLENNHIQGSANSSINIGAYYENELVGVMTFSNIRGKTLSNKEYNLNRFATLKNVIGLASKMISYFIKTYHPKIIVSYSDRRWSIGNMYSKIGFKKETVIQPSYWYIVEGTKRAHKSNFKKELIKRKGMFYSESKTEYENMLDNGFDRIWDCGYDKWIMKIE